MNSLTEALLDETKNLQPVAQIAYHAFGGESVRVQKCLPAIFRSAIVLEASGDFAAHLLEPGIDLGLRRRNGLGIFLADLLLNQRAADQLIEGLAASEIAQSGATGIEHRQAQLIVHITGENGLIVDDGDDAVEHHGSCTKEDWRESEPECCERAHQKDSPRLKKKLK